VMAMVVMVNTSVDTFNFSAIHAQRFCCVIYSIPPTTTICNPNGMDICGGKYLLINSTNLFIFIHHQKDQPALKATYNYTKYCI
jgi:hypothetical protein